MQNTQEELAGIMNEIAAMKRFLVEHTLATTRGGFGFSVIRYIRISLQTSPLSKTGQGRFFQGARGDRLRGPVPIPFSWRKPRVAGIRIRRALEWRPREMLAAQS